MKKSQVFTISILIISVLTLIIVFEYNQFYLNSKSKLSDYLIVDEMLDLSNNYFDTLSKIIGNKIYFQNHQSTSLILFESYLKADYNPLAMILAYENSLGKNNKGMNIFYSFNSLKSDVISGKTQRNITQINLAVTHNYTSDLIIFQNISAINSFNVSFNFTGQLNNLTTCTPSSPGKKIAITGPNNYKYELVTSNNCLINLSAVNGTINDYVLVGFNVLSNNLTVKYSGVDQLSDLNMKILANTSYDNLFKISSSYYNTRLVLSKGGYFLNKSFN